MTNHKTPAQPHDQLKLSDIGVRLLLGDPDSREVQRRSTDEGIGRAAISAKIRNALAIFSKLDGAPGVEVRCHGTTLYNSIYRYDDEMIVNPHVYGIPAPHAPALHLRRLSAAPRWIKWVWPGVAS